MGLIKRKTIKDLQWRGLGLCPMWPAKVPGKPLSPLALSVSQAGSVLPRARQGALQVMPTGCAKDELALGQVTRPLPGAPSPPVYSFPNLPGEEQSLRPADLSHRPENPTQWQMCAGLGKRKVRRGVG